MAVKVGINGLGRIGRLVLRDMVQDPDFEIVGINDFSKSEVLANLIKYDSTQGRVFNTVRVVDGGVEIDGQFIKGLYDRDPANLDWAALGADVVIEATGLYKDAEKAKVHIERGAKKVIITAPAKNEDITIVMGVNDDKYDPEKHHIVSNASCTTNCLAPFAKVLSDEFGIVRGMMTTVHAYTNDQKILDGSHKDLRRARSGACSIIPTTTGAAKAVALVLPELKGKLDGYAARVPVPDGSMVDLVAQLERPVTAQEVNAAMEAASESYLHGILEYTEDPIVSADIIGNKHSSIFDAGLTMVLGGEGDMVKCVSWYDNEAGYSARVADLALLLGSTL